VVSEEVLVLVAVEAVLVLVEEAVEAVSVVVAVEVGVFEDHSCGYLVQKILSLPCWIII